MPNATPQPQNRHIQIFSDGCQDCQKHILDIEVGKCRGCELEVIQLEDKSEKVREKINQYQITNHPTTVIDDEIKVDGMPKFYWQCGGKFYAMLKDKYPLGQ